MYLKSLEIQGFKSFPDKTIVQFDSDITAIVGPNGSGKSNLSDAILWVMGEQSSKTLRGAKMEDVIFGGTQKRAPVGFAEATLILDNRDRALPYDADEVMVTRRYYRSGDSEYYINKQSARLRDINEMFMDTGLGREGYSNISQGRIDEILSLKSTDRREIFEEAAGISKYRHRKEETERRLASTEDNLLRIGDKISELELQIDPLRVQAEKAKKYLDFKDELRKLEIAVWMDSLDRLAAASKKAEEDYTSAAFVLEQAHQALDRLYKQAEVLTADLHTRDEKLEAARAEAAALDAALQKIEAQISLLQSSAENSRQNAARVQEELSQEAGRNSGFAEQIHQEEAHASEAEAAAECLQTDLSAAAEQLRQLSANAEGTSRRYLELRGSQTSLVGRISAHQAAIASLEGEIKQAELRHSELEKEREAGRQRRTQAQQALDACEKARKAAAQEAAAARNSIDGYKLRQSGRIRRRDEQTVALRDCTGKFDALSAKARVYEAMERDYDSYSKSVRLVMQEAKKGLLAHIHGPVSRLIQAQDAHTIAIEIALGAAMQQIVVDTEADAKAAISFLKRKDGGRATFLPRSVIRGKALNETGLEQCRGFVGVAAALVQCHESYRPIVENLLGRTVIAEDLDCAIAIARKYNNRFRLVTLDGQVINSGGSMTGGSVAKEAGILSRTNELKHLKEELALLSAQKAEMEQALFEMQRAVEQSDFELTAARDQLRQAEDQALRLDGEHKQHQVLLNALEEASVSAERESAALAKQLLSGKERIRVLQDELQQLQTQEQSLGHELDKLNLGQSEAAAAANSLSEHISSLKAQLAAEEAKQRAALASADRLRVLQSALSSSMEQKKSLFQHYQDELHSLEDLLQNAASEKSGMEARRSLKQADLQDILAQRAAVESEKTKTERDTQEKSKSILTMERACALLEQKKVTTAMEERQIIDKLWDTYGLTPGTAQSEKGSMESVAVANRRIAELRRKISTIGTPNLGAIDEYARISERYTYLSGQRDDVLTSKRELESIIRNITAEMTSIFTREFSRIDTYFQATFEEMLDRKSVV